MINKLTKEQKSKLPEYRDKWMAIGLSTEKADRPTAEAGIERAYKIAGLQKPKIVWTLSPLSSGIARDIVFHLKKSASVQESVLTSVLTSVRDSVWDSVGDSVRVSVRDSVRDSVGDSVWDSVLDSVLASVRDSMRDLMWDSVRDSVGDSVRDSVRDSVLASVLASMRASMRASVGDPVQAPMWDSVWDSVLASGHGQHDADWLGFYEYFNNVLKLDKQTEKLSGLWMIAKSAGWFLPHKNICWVSERHDVCSLKDGVIHCDGGPAIHYPDGFSIWGLNGVRVPQYLAETKAGVLDIEFFKKERNADVKAEFIRKYGIDRMSHLGKHIDDHCNYTDEWWAKSEYELIDMSPILGSVEYAPHLKMKNQTTGIYHLEGVSPECYNLEQAMKFRLNNKSLKIGGIA